MDFSYSEDQISIGDLARQIFSDKVTTERLKQIEASTDCFDRELWDDLAEAGLLGVAIPEALGGSGFGLTELNLVLEQQGARTALVPLFPSLVLAAAPLLAFGSEAQQRQLLPGLASGDLIMTGAYAEAGGSLATVAHRQDEGWILSGTKVAVRAAHLARYALVSARLDNGEPGLFIVDLQADGVAVTSQRTTTRELEATLILQDVAVSASDQLGDVAGGQVMLDWIQNVSAVALAATQLGVSREALAITAAYVSERQQFGRPIGSFQAIAQRAADCYIDLQAMDSTFIEATWRLSEELPCAEQAAIAKWWACQGGQRIAYACQHLHGGMGADIDYPVHRYFLWSKRLELDAGGSASQLARLGNLLRG
jgi:alkylation response protein AidB-like acyl-CoA dehydrogenase